VPEPCQKTPAADPPAMVNPVGQPARRASAGKFSPSSKSNAYGRTGIRFPWPPELLSFFSLFPPPPSDGFGGDLLTGGRPNARRAVSAEPVLIPHGEFLGPGRTAHPLNIPGTQSYARRSCGPSNSSLLEQLPAQGRRKARRPSGCLSSKSESGHESSTTASAPQLPKVPFPAVSRGGRSGNLWSLAPCVWKALHAICSSEVFTTEQSNRAGKNI